MSPRISTTKKSLPTITTTSTNIERQQQQQQQQQQLVDNNDIGGKQKGQLTFNGGIVVGSSSSATTTLPATVPLAYTQHGRVHENDVLFWSEHLSLSSSDDGLKRFKHGRNRILRSIVKERKARYLKNPTVNLNNINHTYIDKNIDSCSITVTDKERIKIAKEII